MSAIHPDIEALCTAAFTGDLETLSHLLARIPTEWKNQTNSRGQTALYCAARHGQEEVIKILLNEKGIDVNAQEAHGSTALHAASFAPHPNVLSLLLSFGCNTNIQNKSLGEKGLTAFAEARGQACEIWSIYKTGGAKGLARRGYPVMQRKSNLFNTSASKPRVQSSHSRLDVGVRTFSSSLSLTKSSSPLASPVSEGPVGYDNMFLEVPTAPQENDEITSLRDLLRPTPIEGQESSGELEISFSEASGDEQDEELQHPYDRLSFLEKSKQQPNPQPYDLPEETPKQQSNTPPDRILSSSQPPRIKKPIPPVPIAPVMSQSLDIINKTSSGDDIPIQNGEETLIWVKYDQFDPVEITYCLRNLVSEFKKYLFRHEQFYSDLENVSLKNINLFIEREGVELGERLDPRRRLAEYGVKEVDLIVIKLMK